MKPREIDFSDIPELSNKQLTRMRRVGRPTAGDEPRKLIAIRLDAKVLGWLLKSAEKKGLPYQSLVNQIFGRRDEEGQLVNSCTGPDQLSGRRENPDCA